MTNSSVLDHILLLSRALMGCLLCTAGLDVWMSWSSGTTCGSCRSGWRTGSWSTAAPRKPWSRWDKPLSCCRSTRRPRLTLKQFALCAPPSTRLRSTMWPYSAILNMPSLVSCVLTVIFTLPWQIVKVLTLYTPVIEFEERVSTAFIATIKVSHWSSMFIFSFLLTFDYFSFPSQTFRAS